MLIFKFYILEIITLYIIRVILELFFDINIEIGFDTWFAISYHKKKLRGYKTKNNTNNFLLFFTT